MVHYSVLIPQRDSTDAVGRLLPRAVRMFDKLLLPYEIICIDDASAAPAIATLEELLYQLPSTARVALRPAARHQRALDGRTVRCSRRRDPGHAPRAFWPSTTFRT